MWIRPSTPPKSTNAPNEVKDFTLPVYFLPTSAFAQNSAAAFSLSSLATDLIEPTTLCLPRLSSSILIIRNLCSVPKRTPKSAKNLSAHSDAGMNTRTPLTIETTPPFTSSRTRPVKISPDSKAFLISSIPFTASIFFLERVTTPSLSLTRPT